MDKDKDRRKLESADKSQVGSLRQATVWADFDANQNTEKSKWHPHGSFIIKENIYKK